MDCSACLSCGMVVLLVMTGCRLFHIFMVLGKKDVLNTCVRLDPNYTVYSLTIQVTMHKSNNNNFPREAER